MSRPSVAPPSGDGWFAAETDGVPWLFVRGLPYPTHFDGTSRRTVELNGPWKLLLDPREDYFGDDDAPWTDCVVPSVHNAAESPRVDYLGPAWYRRDFTIAELPERGADAVIRLHGALLRGSVWLNGRHLGSFEGGYTPALFSAGEALQRGINHLAIMTDNRLTADSLPPKLLAAHNPGWHTYGGLYRSVDLQYLPPSYIFKAFLREDPKHPGELEPVALTFQAADAPEGNDTGSLSVLLQGPDGRATACGMECAAYTEAPGGLVRLWRGRLRPGFLLRWGPEHPALYRAELDLRQRHGAADNIVFLTGFRTFAVQGERFILNGRPVYLKGICKHEDHPVLGPTQTPELIRGDLDLVQELGANYLRLAHYPHAVEELAAARDRGLLASEEIPLYQAGIGFTAWVQEKRPLRQFPFQLFGLRQLRRKRLRENAERQLLELLERDRNNPSVCFWILGNECYTLGRRAGAHFSGLAAMARWFDPTRPVTNVELTYHVPLLDRLARGWKGMDFLSLNSYFGWYYGSTAELPDFLDGLHKKWPGKPLLLSEFGCDAAPGRREADGPWKAERVRPGKCYSEEYQERTIREYCAVARRRPWIQGLAPWVFCDFYNTWFPGNPVPNYNLKGLLSSRREPKAAFHALKELYHDADP